MALEFLREALKQAAWSANFNLIASATVPVLMFVSITLCRKLTSPSLMGIPATSPSTWPAKNKFEFRLI